MRKKTKVINKKSNKMHTKKEILTIHNDENIDNGRIKWTLQVIDINKLKPYEKNPRIITEEALLELENSFNEIGMCQPLVVSNDLSIISGNARYLQLKKEGCDKVQVMIPDRKLTEKQEKAVVIRMNKTNVGKWDFDSLANNYEIIDLMDWGFTTEELIGVDEEKIEPKCDEDEVPEVKDTVTKRGDIWLLGNHRLMCGDSTMIDDVEKLMNGEKADMVFTDPPYGMRYKSNWKNSVSSKEILNDDSFITEWITSIGGYCFCRFDSYSTLEKSLKEFGHKIFTVIVWDKLSHTAGDLSSWANVHEFIVYFGSEKTTTKREQNVARFRRLDNGAIGKAAKDNMVHPTQKPIELIEYVFECEPHKFIHDPFLGSGSTLIACEKTNRKCYGMELDEHYCDVIVQRWQKYTGKEAILESTGEKYNNLIK